MRWRQLAVCVFALFVMGGCGGVNIAPDPDLPKALVEPIPAKIGLVMTAEQRNFVHSETRSGVVWTVALGAGQQELMRSVMGATFRDIGEFNDLESSRAATDLLAIFEPKLEQYSFATAQETGGVYVAVTIRYRIEVYAPNGERYDSLTLTGYGTALAGALDGEESLQDASKAAMRDAASRFLTQFADTDAGKVLAGGKRLEVSAADAMRALAATGLRIEAVPIRVSRRADPNWKPGAGVLGASPAAAPSTVPSVSPQPISPQTTLPSTPPSTQGSLPAPTDAPAGS